MAAKVGTVAGGEGRPELRCCHVLFVALPGTLPPHICTTVVGGRRKVCIPETTLLC